MNTERFIHYSEDPDFQPMPEPGHGLDRPGCFFYLEGYEPPKHTWPGRYRHVFTGPDDLGEVVNDFGPHEAGDNPTRIVEIFVPAEQLHLLRKVE